MRAFFVSAFRSNGWRRISVKYAIFNVSIYQMILTAMLKFLTLITVFLLATPAFADSKKVVLHLSNQHKLHNLVNNVTNIREAFGESIEIVVVVNGPAVTKFAKFSKTQEKINLMLQQDAEVSVCSIAMKNKNILKHQLIEGVTYLTEGGVAKLIELQSKGYNYIKV